MDDTKWVESLQAAWFALWTGATPPPPHKTLVWETLFDCYNEIATGMIPQGEAESAVEMLDLETYLGMTATERDGLGITPLLEPKR